MDTHQYAKIIQLCQSGRPVVPLLGAGISVGSGIPTTALIVDYLAKVECYFENAAFHPTWDSNLCAISLKELYLDLFGYPDPYQLNAELWQAADLRARDIGIPDDTPGRERLALLVKRKVDEHLARTNEDAFALLACCRALLEIEDQPEAKEKKTLELEARLTRTFPDQEQRRRIIKTYLQAPNLRLGADWRSFLKSVTSSDHDRVDALFQVLVHGRSPGASP